MEYFLDIDGSDLNSGLHDFPFKNLEFALKKLKSNDTLTIHKGVYYLSSTQKIPDGCLIKNYQSEKVEIKFGFRSLEWVEIEKNIWKTKSTDSVLQVFINNKAYFQASFPTIQEDIYAVKSGNFAIAYPSKEIYIKDINQFSNIIGCKYLGIHGSGLVSLNGTITKHSNNTITIKNNAFCWDELYKKDYLDSGTAFIFGSKEFMDENGEWYWNNSELFLQLNANPNTEIIDIRTDYYAFDLSNNKNIIINGIHLFGGNINLINSSDCKVLNTNILYPTPFFTFPDGFEKYNQLFDDNNELYMLEPEKWNGKGITISGNNNTIENCFIAHSWGDGLTIWGNNHNIKNNEIYDCNWIANDCANITISGENHLIEFNTLHRSSRSLLIHRNISSSKISNNHLYNNGINCGDLGMTASYFTNGKNTEIAFNYLHDTKAKYKSHGIYLDNGNSNFNVHHNIVNNCLVGIQLNKPAEKINLYNNTIYNCTYSMGSWGPVGNEFNQILTYNNITNSKIKTKLYDTFYGTEINSNYVYLEDNIFQDPQNDNFQLRKYSYPIDKGITNEYTLPFKGKAPDLGAIESDSEPIEYGSSIIIENEQHYPPKAPLKLKLINNTPNTTVFTWEYPFNYIDSFYLERKISGDTFKIIAKLPSLTLNYNDSNQPPGEYRYRVKAVNKYGISEPSNSVEIFNPKFENSLFLDAENNDLQFGNSIAGDLVINSDHSDWICYKEIDFGIGIYDACLLNMAVPCEQAWQEVQIRIDRPMGRMIGNLITTNTGGWDKFEYRTIPIEKTTGKHDVYIRFEGEQGIGTFDWFNLFDSKGTVIESLPNANKCPKPKNPSRIIAVTIFPNPSSEEVSVSVENIEESIISIRLISTQGKTLLTMIEKNQLPGTQEFYLHDKMNISNLEKGLYFVEVTITGKRVIQSKSYKFMKN
jgi:hypothetical protein